MDWVYCGFVRPMYGSFIVVEREQEREKPKMEGRGLLEGLFFKLIIFFQKKWERKQERERSKRRERNKRGERQRHIPWRMESSSSLPEREIKIRERKREREENERYFL